MKVLGIETSCDETSAAVVEDGTRLLSNIVASQDALHAPYGGIVPELASRRHIETIHTIVNQALNEAHVDLSQIDGIAVTQGPGLIGSLIVGLSYAKALAYKHSLPCVGVNHLEAHLHAVFLEEAAPQHKLQFPFVGLLVSGGHTALYEVQGVGKTKLLATTQDDAAGEAFDKVAKLLGLGYPGGRQIDELSKKGNPNAFSFPIANLKHKEMGFSFSGLKTAVLNLTKQFGELSEETKADIAASFQEAVAKPLLTESLKALEKTKFNKLVVSGGVAANSRIRSLFLEECQKREIQIYFPSLSLCTDNAAMVAAVGYHLIGVTPQLNLSMSPFASSRL